MIFRSKKKLTLPYRRIILALSIYETVFSVFLVLTLPMLPSSDNIWGSMGNDASCKALGFFIYMGSTGVPMYNLSLCVFYVCIILYSMKQKIFEIKIEPFLHAIPILWSLIGGTILLVRGYFNIEAYNIFCWIASYPSDCGTNEAVPCERGANYKQMRMLLLIVPNVFVFVVIVITMGCVCHKVYKLDQRIQQYTFRSPILLKDDVILNRQRRQSTVDFISNKKVAPRRASRDMIRLTKKSSRNKAVMTQALLFVLAYIITWSSVSVIAIFHLANYDPPPFIFQVFARISSPSQGFMNLLVYTAPMIKSFRNHHPEYSWMKTLIEVIKSGGDKE